MYKNKIFELVERRFTTKVFESFISKTQLEQYENICVWGTEILGYRVYKILKKYGCKNIVFCDSNREKHGKNIIDNAKCLSPDELSRIKEDTFVIIASDYINEIENTLQNYRIHYYTDYKMIIMIDYLEQVPVLMHDDTESKEEIVQKIKVVCDSLEDEKSLQVLYKCLENYINYKSVFDKRIELEKKIQCDYSSIFEEDQYFYDELVEFNDESIVVDCGAYIGDTFKEFIYKDLNFKKYYAFEMSKENYRALCENINRTSIRLRKKIEVINAGVYSENKVMTYAKSGEEDGAGATISIDGGTEKAEMVALDKKLQGQLITHIKMDIEGAEVEALKGCKHIIQKYQPTLMICVYHRINDYWNILLYIKNLCGNYKFYMRHHSNGAAETVLYAIPENR